MIEIAREEMIMWLNNPITRGLYEIFKEERINSEDQAFSAALENFHKTCFMERTNKEVMAFGKLECVNHILGTTFFPLYEDLKQMEKNNEPDDKPKNDSIQDFINKIQKILEKNDQNKK